MAALPDEMAFPDQEMRAPPARRGGGVLRAYFGTPLNSVITIASLLALAWIAVPLLRWAVLDATWSGSAETCRAHGGACWAFVIDKFAMSIFGLYPFEERWRPGLLIALFATLVLISIQRRFWSRRLVYAWLVAAPTMFVLMRGGILGLPGVETRLWGGLTLTIFVSVFGLALGLPGGVLLALGRRSRLPVISWVCVAIIEGVRGVPLIAMIFMAAILLPLFTPGIDIDRLFRVQFAYAIFASAYLAEVFRGGLQAIPRGQEEAAQALGLGYWRRMRLVILPQALKSTIPAQVNTFIVLFKDTTLVVIVGIFDFFTTVRAAMGDARWLGFSVEGYIYTALVYLILCLAISRYSQHLERILNPERPD